MLTGSGLAPSRFNVRADHPSGRPVYANTRSGVVALVDEDIDRFLSGRATTCDSLDVLARAGFVVPVDVDEIAEVFDAYEQARHEPVLALTIAPTVACNLRCDYCFQAEHPARQHDDGELDSIVRFVRRRLADQPPIRFDVTWFGGEPLLHLSGIERLSRSFIQAASFNAVPYAARIVTNGTRLTREVATRLRTQRVLRAQITLDGAQHTHDQLRVDPRGRGSYERVLSGIEAASGLLDVDLRIHADRRTARSIPHLLDDLARRGLHHVALTFARIEPPGVFGDRAPVDRRFLEGTEFAELEVRWLTRARDLGFDVDQSVATEHGPTPCMAVNPNHFTFEPGNRVQRCYADVADDRRHDGHLDREGVVHLGPEDERWRRYLPFDLGCADCAYLPLCMGGCPKARVDGALHPSVDDSERLVFKDRYVCHARRFNLRDLLTEGLVR